MSKIKHPFGGIWTQEKLEKVQNYLQTYATALKNQNFKTIYVDAFAGTGYVDSKEKDSIQPSLLEFNEEEVKGFISGSARNALEVVPPFDEYIFIEKNRKRFSDLQKLKTEYPELAERIHPKLAEANEFLQSLCQTDWRNKRAVIFLDPYGMEVKWKTIEAIANTHAIDLWILFPLGVAINRFLRRDGNISENVKKILDEMFGTDEWFQAFFEEKEQRGLFETQTEIEKTANFDSIAKYFNGRLDSVFAGVAKSPLKLYNSKNNPLYLLCFAVGNPDPKAKGLALNLANHILQMR